VFGRRPLNTHHRQARPGCSPGANSSAASSPDRGKKYAMVTRRECGVNKMLADTAPPGYTASYSGLDAARQNIQLASLGGNQIQIELMRRQLEQNKRTADEVAAMNRARGNPGFRHDES
jgi:hypothetical protein